MVLRKLTVALLSLGVILPGVSQALAVRDIKTRSALGEPFNAEIEITDLGDLTSEDVRVALATEQDFERLGIERVFFLTELRFEVEVNRGARSFIRVTSAKRVTEPYLDFVLRLTWPNNTRLQEIPVFLDPPNMKSSKIEEPTAPIVSAAPAPTSAPIVAEVKPVEPTPAAESAPQETTYQIRHRDTLWKIANRVRPAPVSVTQMMQVLYKANPQAFIANNINLLKNGETLRVPTLSEVQAQAGAMDNAHRMANQANTANSNKPLSGQQVSAKANMPKNPPAKVVKAEMKLLAPSAGKVATAGTTNAKGKTDVVAKTSGVTTHSKEVDSLRQQNQKLSHEVSELDSRLKLNDQKIAMQNAKLAQLEAQLKARRLAEEQQAKGHKHADKAVEKKAVATLACALAAQTLVSPDAKAADQPAAGGGGGNAGMLIGVGVLVVIVAAIFFLKGKKSTAEPPKPAQPVTPPPAAKKVEPVKPAAQPAAQPAPQPTPVAQPKPEPKKPADPLEEAQAYLNNDRYPQAVGILNKALVQAPDRSDLHLLLLEIYVKQKDRPAFEEQYVKLEALGELEAIMKADELKALLPQEKKPEPVAAKSDEIPFERVSITPEQPVAAKEAPSLEDLEKDFALSLSQPNMKAVDVPLREEPSFSADVAAKEQEMEALLNSSMEFTFTKPTEPEPAPAASNSLDFSLDLGGLELETKSAAKEELGEKTFSLDNLDEFLAEAKPAPVVDIPKSEAISLDFEKELAAFKEEKKVDEVEPELNLAEGLELEEFNVSQINLPAVTDVKPVDSGIEALDGDFSFADLDAAPVADAEFKLSTKDAAGVGLGDAAAAFDAELGHDSALALDDEQPAAASEVDDVVLALDKEFAFLASTDENTTRLELARAYVDMGDKAGARDLLEEVIAEGSDNQKAEAQGMLVRIS